MIGIKQALYNVFSNFVENQWWFLVILMILGIVFLFFIYESGDRSYENRKVLDFSSRLVALPIVIIFGYLIINEYYLMLTLLLTGVVLYLAYKVGLISL